MQFGFNRLKAEAYLALARLMDAAPNWDQLEQRIKTYGPVIAGAVGAGAYAALGQHRTQHPQSKTESFVRGASSGTLVAFRPVNGAISAVGIAAGQTAMRLICQHVANKAGRFGGVTAAVAAIGAATVYARQWANQHERLRHLNAAGLSGWLGEADLRDLLTELGLTNPEDILKPQHDR
jgi:hypothetical protein